MLKVTVAKSEQQALEGIRDAKTLYYIVIGEGESKVIMNVGQKTYEGVSKLLNEKPKK